MEPGGSGITGQFHVDMASAARQSLGLAAIVSAERAEASLWRRSKLVRENDARARIFEKYQPLARSITFSEFNRRRGSGVEIDDIRQLAVEGLLQAIDRFDATRNIPFSAYARKRIKGCIANGLGKSSERSAYYRYRLRIERERLRSLDEQAHEDQNPISRISGLATLIAIGIMLEAGRENELEELPSADASAYETAAWNEMRERLQVQLQALALQQQFVLQQHYQNGVSFGEIAKVLKLSKGRISQIHRSALVALRRELERFV